MARALLFAPKAALRGDIFEVRATIAHAMETGYRVDSNGTPVPRDVIRRLECRYEGELVFAADLWPAISANPLLAFHLRATTSGTISVTWTGDKGFSQTESVSITVS